MKAQADVISSVIIIIIAITLVSTAYMWGMPLIRKRQDTALVERAYKFFDRNNFNSIVKKIEYISKNGGEDTFSLDIDGVWTFYPSEANFIENNSIQFSFYSRVSNIAVDAGWVSLSTANTDDIGTVGVDDASVVWARSDRYGDGFNMTYKVWFRELDESPAKGYKINLINPTAPQNEIRSSAGKSVRISYGGTRTLSDGKILITIEIKIFLI